jgi:hypothetical protein
MERPQRYWFPDERYRWGSGVPQTWQGWLVLVGYTTVVLAPAALLEGDRGGVATLAAVAVATPLLVWLHVKKGEPPGSQPPGPAPRPDRTSR